MRFQNIPIKDIMKEAVYYGGLIVDVREEQEFINAHIPMAINVPLEDIKAGTHNLPKNKVLLLYCQHGGASALAARILSQAGYRVINTIGGMAQYEGSLTRLTSKNKTRII
jgi:rhodanese-related sulfurtransferase